LHSKATEFAVKMVYILAQLDIQRHNAKPVTVLTYIFFYLKKYSSVLSILPNKKEIQKLRFF
jgi:hypothetical protein